MTRLVPPMTDNLPFTSQYLPPNYNFEINKTLRTIKKHNCKTVTLQFPDGLLRYAPAIIDLITEHTDATSIILNDVVYGACCVDDTSIKSDLLVHYGHSCLVPVTEMKCRVLYVFVDIQIDVEHLYNIIKREFWNEKEISVVGTIQFNSSINRLKRMSLYSNDVEKSFSCVSADGEKVDQNHDELKVKIEKSIDESHDELKVNIEKSIDESHDELKVNIEKSIDESHDELKVKIENVEKAKVEIEKIENERYSDDKKTACNNSICHDEQRKNLACFKSEKSMKHISNDLKNLNLINLTTVETSSTNIIKNKKYSNVNIPQIKPLSKGEVLGCTSPKIQSQVIISIGDGRFHLESVMINNPTKSFYKYCPFNKILTREFYDYNKLVTSRSSSIAKAFRGKTFGIILGSLGKQGNKTILNNIKTKLNIYKLYNFMMEEITPNLLDRYGFIDAYVQISCPRLSSDWSDSFNKPLLSPFEVFYEGGEYVMDYYSNEGYGPHKNYNNVL